MKKHNHLHKHLMKTNVNVNIHIDEKKKKDHHHKHHHKKTHRRVRSTHYFTNPTYNAALPFYLANSFYNKPSPSTMSQEQYEQLAISHRAEMIKRVQNILAEKLNSVERSQSKTEEVLNELKKKPKERKKPRSITIKKKKVGGTNATVTAAAASSLEKQKHAKAKEIEESMYKGQFHRKEKPHVTTEHHNFGEKEGTIHQLEDFAEHQDEAFSKGSKVGFVGKDGRFRDHTGKFSNQFRLEQKKEAFEKLKQKQKDDIPYSGGVLGGLIKTGKTAGGLAIDTGKEVLGAAKTGAGMAIAGAAAGATASTLGLNPEAGVAMAAAAGGAGGTRRLGVVV